jgi:hypothetical protein
MNRIIGVTSAMPSSSRRAFGRRNQDSFAMKLLVDGLDNFKLTKWDIVNPQPRNCLTEALGLPLAVWRCSQGKHAHLNPRRL